MLNESIKTQKTLHEDNYHKTVQYTDKDQYGEMTYCINYTKEFHKDYPDGYIWRTC